MPNAENEPTPRKKYFYCRACNKNSRFENEFGMDSTFTRFGKKKVIGAPRTDVRAFLWSMGDGIFPRKNKNLQCLHCGSSDVKEVKTSEVPASLLTEKLIRYAHCEKCKHDTPWPPTPIILKNTLSLKLDWKKFSTHCENCGAKTSWDIYKEEIQN